MAEIKLEAQIREEVGKEAVKKLRKQNLIPAVVYKGKNALNIKVSTKELREAIHTKAGENVVINLQIADDSQKKTKTSGKTKGAARTVIIKEIQYHPVRGDILHLDFNEISLTEVLTVKVPIKVKGEAPGLKEGGVLEHVLWEIEVECLPTEIPENIPVDVSQMKIGDAILLENLKAPAGVKILGEGQATVITLGLPHVEKEEAAPAEEMLEPEVIMEKKPEEEEEEAAEKPRKEKEPEKQS
ncbi:MAG: 50S ribosomal protein L25 [Candidatus Omnitrophica bacterium]|nr:50S ribosomal protein L25 [Candidatus Omnitrophota bacterium]